MFKIISQQIKRAVFGCTLLDMIGKRVLAINGWKLLVLGNVLIILNTFRTVSVDDWTPKFPINVSNVLSFREHKLKQLTQTYINV